MKKMKPAWPADVDLAQRFSHSANAPVVALLTNGELWSAHSDPAEEFYFGLKDIAGAKVYCPDSGHYAYEMAYTSHGVIFGLVLGMRAIYTRLPQSEEWAKANGGRKFLRICHGWFEFEVKYDRGLSSSKWLKRAYEETN